MAEHNELTDIANYITNSSRPYPKLTLRFAIVAKLCQMY